ncbi:asparagine synthase (glutamine-hydrolysing) [Clostridium cavendishii DSM 21758]|uniref:asparagine synthase (glutamine-hydrolyzing) n=1 Tax=Clostridium cavendishii DSM 21758 TaxID=1121302 RepID=A0A1M6MT41_9CLOT|nr:asparagine synthase (glutamine-hydrolyzing) [Clostridium cavendishii]SHJ86705.1 asparagine synthase (glutamine-hydrolysing) [Clostridium cavendishii DSM 21758]
MCGICGYFDMTKSNRCNRRIITNMINKLEHRGPDGEQVLCNGSIALGFTRLSIIGLSGGMQPLSNENNKIFLICNGEIFNYIELRAELKSRGHVFKTNTDVEVILHLYEEHGSSCIEYLNGQFAFVIYDSVKNIMLCARDHFGVIPFFYTIADNFFIFGSEIKSILEHPSVKREVDLTGLDQVLTFPGLISPRTLFKNINSLKSGHYLIVKPDLYDVKEFEYWDIDFPEIGHEDYEKSISYYTKELGERINESVKLRLRSDVPIGLYLSGGLDSSIIAAKVKELSPNIIRHSFSIDFSDEQISEYEYQHCIQQFINSIHHSKTFQYSDISSRLDKVIYHCECPLRETYNTASEALSEAARRENIKVILTGEGADELFAGYVGYKFDRIRSKKNFGDEFAIQERKIQELLWGIDGFVYEKEYYKNSSVKKELYSNGMLEIFDKFDCLNHFVVNKKRMVNRDIINQRSYIDLKLRLADHLISDHGDRMSYANSIEARYPFLDKNLAELAARIPPRFKLKDGNEKYILKKVSKNWIPRKILDREKFAFTAPGSAYILQNSKEYVNDILSYSTIKRQGYFNPNTVEQLKKKYCSQGFRLNVPFESDLLITVITFGILSEKFNLPNFNG